MRRDERDATAPRTTAGTVRVGVVRGRAAAGACGSGGPAPPGGVAPGGLPHTSGLAIGALICAIGSFFVCPVIGAVVAIALAYNASNHIADSGGSIRGSGMATAAKVLGWIHLALAILVVLAIDLALLNV